MIDQPTSVAVNSTWALSGGDENLAKLGKANHVEVRMTRAGDGFNVLVFGTVAGQRVVLASGNLKIDELGTELAGLFEPVPNTTLKRDERFWPSVEG